MILQIGNQPYLSVCLHKMTLSKDIPLVLCSAEFVSKDGCGAAVLLLVGDIAFTAVLGRCNVLLCDSEKGASSAMSLGGSQMDITSIEERTRFRTT